MASENQGRIPTTRILLYLIALFAIIAVACHFLGYSQRAWWMSVMVGYGLVLVPIFEIGDYIVYQYLVGDTDE